MKKHPNFNPTINDIATVLDQNYLKTASDFKICKTKRIDRAFRSDRRQNYMTIDLEAILYATDSVNEKFSFWDIPNN